jgi:LPXTG-motif cell wall-anchored protein
MATGVLSNPLYLTLGSVDPYGLAIDFANGGAIYIDTSEDSIKLVNSSDGTVGPDLADPSSLTPPKDFIWDGKFDSNGVFWTMSANCCQEEVSGNIFTYKTGETEWAYQGTTSQDVSGPLAVGTSTSALQPQPLPDTGASSMLVAALSVSGVALVALGFAGVMISRRRKA